MYVGLSPKEACRRYVGENIVLLCVDILLVIAVLGLLVKMEFQLGDLEADAPKPNGVTTLDLMTTVFLLPENKPTLPFNNGLGLLGSILCLFERAVNEVIFSVVDDVDQLVLLILRLFQRF